MTINTGSDPAMSENVIANITKLQLMEQQLISSLDANPSFTVNQKNEIVAKIKQVSTIRANLYATIGNLNDNYVDKLTTSQSILGDQLAAIDIVEKELEASRNSLQEMEDIKNNTQRLIEINSYYSDKYAESANLMKIIIYMLIPIIILAMLNRYNLLPTNIYYVLVAIIALIASIYLWSGLFTIWSRNNMEYDTFDWNFVAANAPKPGKRIDDPWGLPSTCIDQRCCSTGLEWSSALGQCVASTSGSGTGTSTSTSSSTGTGTGAATGTGAGASAITSTPTTTASSSSLGSSAFTGTTSAVLASTPGHSTSPVAATLASLSAGTHTESFGNMFGQHRNCPFKKPDVILGGEFITPYNPSSFIKYN